MDDRVLVVEKTLEELAEISFRDSIVDLRQVLLSRISILSSQIPTTGMFSEILKINISLALKGLSDTVVFIDRAYSSNVEAQKPIREFLRFLLSSFPAEYDPVFVEKLVDLSAILSAILDALLANGKDNVLKGSTEESVILFIKLYSAYQDEFFNHGIDPLKVLGTIILYTNPREVLSKFMLDSTPFIAKEQ